MSKRATPMHRPNPNVKFIMTNVRQARDRSTLGYSTARRRFGSIANVHTRRVFVRVYILSPEVGLNSFLSSSNDPRWNRRNH